MSVRFVCRSCRNRSLLGGRERRSLQYLSFDRRSSSASPHQQWLSTATERSPGQQDSGASRSNDPPYVGRYSRHKMLQGAEMLAILNEDDSPAPIRHPSYPGRTNTDPITALAKELRKAKQENSTDVIFWQRLQKLVQTMKELQVERMPPGCSWMQSDISHFALRQTERWLAYKSSKAETDTSIELQLAPSEILATLRSSCLRQSVRCSNVLWQMTTSMLERQATNENLPKEHLEELVKVWHIALSIPAGSPDAVQPEFPDWSFLPSDYSSPSPGSSEDRLREVISRGLYPFIAQLTNDILERHDMTMQDDFQPLIKLLSGTISAAEGISVPPIVRSKLQHTQSSIRERYMQLFKRFNISIANDDDNHKPPPAEGDSGTRKASTPKTGDHATTHWSHALTSPKAPGRFIEIALKNLSRAVEQRNTSVADDVLTHVLDATRTYPDIDLSNSVYESLMLTYFSLRAPEKALSVWQVFLKAGRQPTVSTYSALMRGAQHVRDVDGSERFWQGMRQANIQPDSVAWGLRISGLLNGGRIEAGLDALVEMSSEWLKAAREVHQEHAKLTKSGRASMKIKVPTAELIAMFPVDVNGVPRPNVIIMNLAVGALARKPRGREHIDEVLSWGRAFDLEPDEFTYNSIINLFLSNGQTREALNALGRMQQQGIQVNSTTWTVLLTNLMEDGTLEDLSAEEQETKTMQFLSAIERSSDAKVDAKGYAVVIDRLLKRYDNPAAAQKILARMVEQGVQPSPHIYTILVTSLFQQKPSPNFAAIESIWSQIRAQDVKLDNIFFDRMIEGYCAHHRVFGLQPALDFLNRLRKLNRYPSWPTMIALARAMTDRRDWSRLNRLVGDVISWEDKAGLPGIHVGEREYYRKDFWRFILSTQQQGNELGSLLQQIIPKLSR